MANDRCVYDIPEELYKLEQREEVSEEPGVSIPRVTPYTTEAANIGALVEMFSEFLSRFATTQQSIIQRLNVIQNSLQVIYNKTIPQGVVDYFPITATSEKQNFHPGEGESWFQVQIVNDGVNELYYKSNGLSDYPNQPNDTPKLEGGESMAISPNRGVIEYVTLWCDVGITTDVRLFCLK